MDCFPSAACLPEKRVQSIHTHIQLKSPQCKPNHSPSHSLCLVHWRSQLSAAEGWHTTVLQCMNTCQQKNTKEFRLAEVDSRLPDRHASKRKCTTRVNIVTRLCFSVENPLISPKTQTPYRFLLGDQRDRINKGEHLDDEPLVVGGVWEPRGAIHRDQGGEVPVIVVGTPGETQSEGVDQQGRNSRAPGF